MMDTLVERIALMFEDVMEYHLSDHFVRTIIATVFDQLAQPSLETIKAGHAATERQFDLTVAYTKLWQSMLAAARKEALGED